MSSFLVSGLLLFQSGLFTATEFATFAGPDFHGEFSDFHFWFEFESPTFDLEKRVA